MAEVAIPDEALAFWATLAISNENELVTNDSYLIGLFTNDLTPAFGTKYTDLVQPVGGWYVLGPLNTLDRDRFTTVTQVDHVRRYKFTPNSTPPRPFWLGAGASETVYGLFAVNAFTAPNYKLVGLRRFAAPITIAAGTLLTVEVVFTMRSELY